MVWWIMLPVTGVTFVAPVLHSSPTRPTQAFSGVTFTVTVHSPSVCSNVVESNVDTVGS